MEINQHFLTKNACYITGKYIIQKGIMIHSTAFPGIRAKNFLSSWNTYHPNGKEVCVHGFIDDISTNQTLPWNMRGWHCAGAGNNELIGIEVCEPKDYADKEYFEKVKKRVIDLCVYLCKKFNWNADVITTHCEGYARYGSSYASNHADIYHWWKKYHNYTMDNLRADVKKVLEMRKMFEDGQELEALDYLVDKGRITDKEYWLKALEVVKNQKWLIIKWANDVIMLEDK